jgi:hypothetical protein
MFADAFSHYCELVDRVKLYCTNKIGNPAEVFSDYSFILIQTTGRILVAIMFEDSVF